MKEVPFYNIKVEVKDDNGCSVFVCHMENDVDVVWQRISNTLIILGAYEPGKRNMYYNRASTLATAIFMHWNCSSLVGVDGFSELMLEPKMIESKKGYHRYPLFAQIILRRDDFPLIHVTEGDLS